MERFKDLSQLHEGCTIMKIAEGGKLEFSDFLMVHPSNEDYIFVLDSVTQDANKLYIPLMIHEEYYVGEYDQAFVTAKRIEALEFEVKRLQLRINMLKNEKGLL